VDHRKGEEPRRYFRAGDRCFQRNGEWYVSTREGIDVGPYRTRAAADTAAKRLVDMLRDVTDPVMARRLIENFQPAKDPWDGRSKR
jgi:hypothetical protein